jgi:signal transduction histidine kinase
MRDWLRGKRGGLIGFLAIVALVVGGLGWVTADVLRLEREQFASRCEAEHVRAEADWAGKRRLALWRLDTQIYNDFAREANLPFESYVAVDTPRTEPAETTILELMPVPGVATTTWMPRRFIVGAADDWRSDQSLRLTVCRVLNVSDRAPAPPSYRPDPLLAELAHAQTFRKLLTEVHQQQEQLSKLSPIDDKDAERQVQANANSNSQAQNANAQQKIDPDAALRINRAKTEKGYTPAFPSKDGSDMKRGAVDTKQVFALVGPLFPLWLNDEHLVVARLVQIGPKVACEVTLLDWPRLRSMLTEIIGDLFPHVVFRPVRDGAQPDPDRAMTALPIELDPDPPTLLTPAARTWTPLRIGLALAWTAALIALTAVGLGGWSLIDLSERRIRFVSAVTHELRTPLTTLRLYLDMLTGGLVKEERQKEEYLHTLHTEADRLHRLIGNVLDFSRLENGRPRLERSDVAVGALLEQVRHTWESHCQSADKDLIVENTAGDARLFTDVQLVHQILGNLIDNACKYSRGAEDQRLWMRATAADARLVFEVEDRGPGVSPRDGQAIFRPFRRGRDVDVTAGGVGLGLALAQRWAELLGGRLELVRGNGTGACFRLELPTKPVGHV